MCKGCGGAEHGWPGAFQVASDSSGRRLADLTRAADEQWEGLPRIRNARGEPTGKARRAAVKGALAAITAWLHHDDGLRAGLAAVGEPLRRKPHAEGRRRGTRTPEEDRDFVRTHIIPRLVEEFGTAQMAAFQARAVETHFWCELFAQIARALSECKNQYEKAKQLVTDALTGGSGSPPPMWARVLPYQDVLRRAVDLTFALLPVAAGLPAPEAVFELIWPVRVLTCLMCKDPSEHRAVREYCLNPILSWGEARVREEVRKRMGWTFPDEWRGFDLGGGDAGAA